MHLQFNLFDSVDITMPKGLNTWGISIQIH